MPNLVVDASVAVKWYLEEPESAKARLLLDAGHVLLAPDLVLSEIANALWKANRSGRVSAEMVGEALAGAPRLFDILVETQSLLVEAAQIAMKLGHPVYDCVDVVASTRLRAPLVTSDAKLVTKLAGTPDASNVVLLADWKP